MWWREMYMVEPLTVNSRAVAPQPVIAGATDLAGEILIELEPIATLSGGLLRFLCFLRRERCLELLHSVLERDQSEVGHGRGHPGRLNVDGWPCGPACEV